MNLKSICGYIQILLAGLLITVPMAVQAEASAEKKTDRNIVLAADPWCPYNCVPDSAFEGYLVDIAREVFEPQGYQLKYINLPWRRALEFSRQGLTHGVLGVIHGNLHGNTIGRIPLGYDDTVLIARPGEAFSYQGPASLHNLRIGVITHYSYDNGGAIDQFIESNADNVEVLYHEAALESLLLMLVSNRIDVVIENRYVAIHKINNLQLASRVELITTGIQNPVYIGFTPDTLGQRHAQILDEGMKHLRSQGKLPAILARYGLPDWQSHTGPREAASGNRKK